MLENGVYVPKWCVKVDRPVPRIVSLHSSEKDAREFAEGINGRYQTTEYYVEEWQPRLWAESGSK